MADDTSTLLQQLVAEQAAQRSAPVSNLARQLRKKFLEQGLEGAIRVSGRNVDDAERRRLLNQLDPDIFPK